MKSKIITILVLGILVLPILASAQGLIPQNCRSASDGGVNCSLGDLKILVINVINFLLVSAGFVALLFVVIGGVRMLISAGNPEGIKVGKATLFNALSGFVLVFASFIILNLVLGTLSNFTNFDQLINFWQ